MYLLDTNICIYLIKRKFPHLQVRVQREPLFNIAVSAVTVAELEFGIAKSLYPKKNRVLLFSFLSPFKLIAFGPEDAEHFGLIRHDLNRRGTPIGPYDLQLAAQCQSRDLTLVTNNTKEFERVPELKLENWTLE
ncbi:MAG: type II toxin-antitoxin system VapC family toxin [Deltaproteobacteria bacterium]|nr:type II toxin-antitoxin system VapC family toxin [Deltaproteobacteria bacterium]MBN2673034.1 type II toxin-antitoxin system VapC family toxin [Deltaproteobacteria bacterium]